MNEFRCLKKDCPQYNTEFDKNCLVDGQCCEYTKWLEKRFLNLRTLSIEEILLEIGAKGLCEPDTDCGCDIGDLAPCGVDCTKCRPASCKIATAEDVLKYPNLELDEGDLLFKEFEVIK